MKILNLKSIFSINLKKLSKSIERKKSNDQIQIIDSNLIGILSVFMNCLISGFASVYFEKILKESRTSVVIRNIQLSLFGILFSLIPVLIKDYNLVSEKGFFQGYNFVVWSVILIQAIGGLIVAFVIKYADNILKEFANSISILLISFVSYFFLKNFVPNEIFMLGASLVVGSTFLYRYENKPSITLVADQIQKN